MRSTLLVIAVIGIALLVFSSVFVGAGDTPMSAVMQVLRARDVSRTSIIVWEVRLPRAFLAVLVGGGLAVAGSIIQSLTRNPLADPGILGVNAGASFFVILAASFIDGPAYYQSMLFGFVGAMIMSVIVLILGARVPPPTLILFGVAIAAVMTGVTTGLSLLFPQSFEAFRGWAAGSVAGRPMEMATTLLPFIVIGLVLALISASAVSQMELGPDMAQALGVNVRWTRTLAIITLSILAGSATSAAGPMVFVGLIIPHFARWIVGPRLAWVLAYSFCIGAGLLIVADMVGRVLVNRQEVPAGVVFSFLGAPILIYLVIRQSHGS